MWTYRCTIHEYNQVLTVTIVELRAYDVERSILRILDAIMLSQFKSRSQFYVFPEPMFYVHPNSTTIFNFEAMKNFFRNLFFQIRFTLSASNNFLFIGYYKLLYRPKPGTIEQIIHAYSKSISKPFIIIQIGANDGITHDPVHKFIKRDKWNGVLLEPQKYVFEKFLKLLYKKNNSIKVLNAALGYEDGEANIYKIGFSTSRWATGLTTFDRATLEKAFENGHVERKCINEGIQIPKDKSLHIVKEKVAIISAKTLYKSCAITAINLLMIDTEGFDFEVIKMIPLDDITPGVIIYENTHLSDKDYEVCSGYLINHDYLVEKIGANTIAIQTSINKSLSH